MAREWDHGISIQERMGFSFFMKQNRSVFLVCSFSIKGLKLEKKSSLVKTARELETGDVAEHHGCVVHRLTSRGDKLSSRWALM